MGDSIRVRSSNGSLLFEPPNTTKPDGTPYRVFTPFYRRGCLQTGIPPRQPLPAPKAVSLFQSDAGISLDDLGLMPEIDWYGGLAEEWSPGEAGAANRLTEFLSAGIEHYDEGRNRPDQRYVSRLSPHLHFGELSPNQAWFSVQEKYTGGELSDDADELFALVFGADEPTG